MSKEMILIHGGINWTWYCHLTFDNDGFAVVTKEYRLHDFDESQGASSHPSKESIQGSYRICELPVSHTDSFGKPRTAFGITVNDTVSHRFKQPIGRWNLGERLDT
jgi:hypothetical protein